MHLLTAIGEGVVSFVASNIDDIFILTLFFAQKTLRRWHIVVGQYLGLTALVAISLLGYFARFIVPPIWLALLGLAPIVIGIRKFFQGRGGNEVEPETTAGHASILTVASVTFANGGDNIGIYTPVFAGSDGATLVVILFVFFLLVAVWCAVGYYLGKHALVARTLEQRGHIVVPLVLIALGLYIIVRGLKQS